MANYLINKIREYYIYITLIISLLILCLSAGVIYIHFATAPSSNIIVYLNNTSNKIINGTITDLYTFIVLGAILVFTNFFIEKELLLKNTKMTYVMSIGSIILSVLILLSISAILKVN